jgi:hypothetical protein
LNGGSHKGMHHVFRDTAGKNEEVSCTMSANI